MELKLLGSLNYTGSFDLPKSFRRFLIKENMLLMQLDYNKESIRHHHQQKSAEGSGHLDCMYCIILCSVSFSYPEKKFAVV